MTRLREWFNTWVVGYGRRRGLCGYVDYAPLTYVGGERGEITAWRNTRRVCMQELHDAPHVEAQIKNIVVRELLLGLASCVRYTLKPSGFGCGDMEALASIHVVKFDLKTGEQDGTRSE